MAREAETDHVVVLDVPLLVESGRSDMAWAWWWWTSTRGRPRPTFGANQRGVPEADAWAGWPVRASWEERLAKADQVIGNSGDRVLRPGWTRSGGGRGPAHLEPPAAG